MRVPALALLAAALLGFAALPAHAQAPTTFVSNLGQSSGGEAAVDSFDKAQVFTTGAAGATLTSVELKVSPGAGTSVFTVAIWSADSNDKPLASLGTLTPPGTLVEGTNSFTTSGITLAGSTTYVVVVDGTSGNLLVKNAAAAANDEDAGAQAGWSIDDDSLYRTASSTGGWTVYMEATYIRLKGTIENTDLMPQAWLARFGRAVADQVVDAVQGRMAASRQAGVEVSLAGQRIGGGAEEDAEAREESEAQARLATLSNWLRDGTEEEANRPRSRAVAQRELLTGSAFALTGEAGATGGGTMALWGRGAIAGFNGRDGELKLDGEVVSGMLGTDWTRGSWTAGLMLSHARGTGGYRDGAGAGSGSSGKVESTLTGVFPYGRYVANERWSFWGVAGYGAGELTLTPENGRPIGTDIDLTMGALGLRGVAVQAGAEGGPELAVTADAMAVRTISEAARGDGGNLASAEADVTRLRLGLEGSWRGLEVGGGALVPSLEVGLRHDGGDAETGFGLEVGGGLAWTQAERGIAAEVRGRGLLSHESKGFRERGLSGGLTWDPTPGSDRGVRLTLTQTLGASATGGVNALLGRETLAGLAANDNGNGLRRRRLDIKLGYGFAAFGDRFTSTPEVGVGFSDTGRDTTLGWRLGVAQAGPNALEIALEARRREPANDNTDPVHEIGLRLTARW